MRYRPLGSSGLQISEIALGSWLTMAGGLERDQAQRCLNAALDAGINFIDTANIYGRGIAESFLGDALQGVARDRYAIATKLYFPMTDRDRGLSRPQIIKQLDASLARLRCGHIDLYQCHRFDDQVPLEETMRALTEVIRQGKVRFIGFSEWPMHGIRAAAAITGVEHFVSSQPQYSMLHRDIEAEVIPWCAAHGVSQIVWSPLAQGVLTGKYLPGQPPPTDARASSTSMGHHFNRDWLAPGVLRAVQAMRPLAQEAGLTLSQFALAWVLRQDNVAAAIIGASKPAQVSENVAAAGASVDPALFLRAERLLVTALGSEAPGAAGGG